VFCKASIRRNLKLKSKGPKCNELQGSITPKGRGNPHRIMSKLTPHRCVTILRPSRYGKNSWCSCVLGIDQLSSHFHTLDICMLQLYDINLSRKVSIPQFALASPNVDSA
jgi:hypothetical protein